MTFATMKRLGQKSSRSGRRVRNGAPIGFIEQTDAPSSFLSSAGHLATRRINLHPQVNKSNGCCVIKDRSTTISAGDHGDGAAERLWDFDKCAKARRKKSLAVSLSVFSLCSADDRALGGTALLPPRVRERSLCVRVARLAALALQHYYY